MFGITYLFSYKGILFISLLTFLVWLLGDYPQWRAKRANNVAVTTETATSKTAETKSVQPDNVKHQRPIENLSLAHYILVSPFAAIYILGRAILDAIRYSFYFVLWWCEKSVPYIDDWLFDKATIWIPNKYNQLESWWISTGKPGFVSHKQQFQQQTLPILIENLELFFKKTYQVGCIVASSIQDFINAWKRFTQRHDWRQLATDLSNVAYTVIWNPSVWIVTRSIRLATLVYRGLRAAAVSIRDDVIWISTTLIPSMYNYTISTRLVKQCITSTTKLIKVIEQVCLGIHVYLLIPTLGRFLTWLVKSIDQLILLLQDNTLQQRLTRIYRFTAPHLTWILFELGGIATDIATWMHLVFVQVLYPAYALFMKRVVPRLAIAYQKVVIHWGYELHIYPAWLIIYPYMNTPLLWAYTHLTVPMLNGIYTFVVSISSFVTEHLVVKLQILFSKMIEISWSSSQWMYNVAQTWLIKQAPVLSGLIQTLYTLMINSCDWEGLKQDTWLIVSELYDWTSKQSNVLYFSLERSLSAWAKEQGAQDKKM